MPSAPTHGAKGLHVLSVHTMTTVKSTEHSAAFCMLTACFNTWISSAFGWLSPSLNLLSELSPFSFSQVYCGDWFPFFPLLQRKQAARGAQVHNWDHREAYFQGL